MESKITHYVVKPEHFMTKLFYTNEGKLLYSRHWPEIPPVQSSIYKDAAMVNDFNNKMKYLLRFPVEVTNPDKAFFEIVFSGRRIERGQFYEIKNPVRIEGNSVEIQEIE